MLDEVAHDFVVHKNIGRAQPILKLPWKPGEKVKMATQEQAAAAIVGIICCKRSKRTRTCWVKPWMTENHRSKKGAQNTLVQELRLLDMSAYKNYLRMDDASYQELLGLVTPILEKCDTVMRRAITPAEMLATTLRFLATGRCKIKYRSLYLPYFH